MPKTIFVFCNPEDVIKTFDNCPESKHYKDVLSRLEKAANEMGYPCFLKDAIFSGKHDWNNTH